MNTKVSYGKLAPEVIGGLGVVVSSLMRRGNEGSAPVKILSLPEVIEFSDSGVWGEEPDDPALDSKVFRVSDFQGDFRLNYDSAPPRKITPERIKRFALRPGDILVVKSSGSANSVVSGRVAVFEDRIGETYAASNFLLRLRPKPTIDPQYLTFVLGSPPVREAVAEAVKTMTYPNLSFRIYSQIQVPVIPLPDQILVGHFFTALLNCSPLPELPSYLTEQRRIVAKIEKLAAKIDDARTLRQQAVEEAETIVKSELNLLIARLHAKHESTTLAEVTTFIGDMNHEMPTAVDAGVAFISPKDFSDDGTINFTGTKRISHFDFERLSKKCRPQKGDILLARYGTVGASRIVNTDEPFLASYSIAVVRPDLQCTCARYLNWLISSPDVQQQVLSGIRGGIQADLGLKTIRQLRMPLPPLPEQHRIVVELDALQAKVDALKRLQADSAAEMNALLPSILDKAFKGEL